MSIESVMPYSHLILRRPLLLLPPIPPRIRVFSNESTLRMRWPKYWSFSSSISPSNEHSGLISFRMDWLDLLAVHKIYSIFSNNLQGKSCIYLNISVKLLKTVKLLQNIKNLSFNLRKREYEQSSPWEDNPSNLHSGLITGAEFTLYLEKETLSQETKTKDEFC